MQSIDCQPLVRAQGVVSYADQYVNYLNFFSLLGHAGSELTCRNVPQCWAPFVRYLGHFVDNCLTYADLPGWEADAVPWLPLYHALADKRRAVEITSTARPELVHGLYCADTEWPCPLRARTAERAFLVTCNGSFFRDEVLAYHKRLQAYVPKKRRAVIVPCTATKPYPSPLHEAVLARIDRERWYVVVATGVLGLVPEDLWGGMPHYDAGLPYLWRCRDWVSWYFTAHPHEGVVVYSDFYAPAVADGLRDVPVPAAFVLGTHYRDLYENLLLDERLMALRKAVASMDRQLDGRGV